MAHDPTITFARASTGLRRLDRETVVDAALALIAAEDSSGLSMRQLGRALRSRRCPSTTGSRQERLLDAAADRLLAAVIVPPTPSAATGGIG